jgi:hypothetical protein
VHWVITPGPFALLSKGIALARDRQQESRRTMETATLNMAREEGGGRREGKGIKE